MLLCYVTDRKFFGAENQTGAVVKAIERAAAAGIDWIQIREKDLPASELLNLVRRAVAAARAKSDTPARVLVNDRLDVALAANAAGVHLGGDSAPAEEVVRWCRAGNAPRGFLVGVSCHQLDEAIQAERAGVDYIFFGPVFETPSKARFGPPQGIEKLAEVCRHVRVPVLAIGGVNEENAATCLRAGAAGIAAIRLFQQAADPTALARTISRLRSTS